MMLRLSATSILLLAAQDAHVAQAGHRLQRATLPGSTSTITSGAPLANAYTFQTIDVPFGVPGVDFDMQIVWINNAGVITVQYQSPRSPQFLDNMHTAVFENGAWRSLDVPGATSTGGTNMNRRGEVVLTHTSGDGIWHASVHGPLGLRAIPDLPEYPGGIVTQGVNERGGVAAVVIDASGTGRGLLGDVVAANVFDFPDPGVIYTQPNMINASEKAVGVYVLGDGSWHAFMRTGGQLINIDPPTGSNPAATAINDTGTVLGAYVNPAGILTGYLQRSTVFVEFGVPGATYTLPYFINDRSVISGIYGDSSGVPHGFLAVPR